MEVVEDGRCFVCGPDNTGGLQARFTIDRPRQAASCRTRVPARFQGWQDVVHGGVLATLLDEACIYACRSQGDRFVTAELAVRYKKPVPVETDLVVSAEVVQRRKRLFTVRARLEVNGQVHAEADSKVLSVA